MKRLVSVFAVVGLLGAAALSAEEHTPPAGQPQAGPPDQLQQLELQSRQIEMQNRQLDLQAHQDKVTLQREMEKLSLQQRQIELEREQRALHGQPDMVPMGQHPMGQSAKGMHPMHCWRGAGALLLLCVVVNILVAVWVYQDIRRRNSGSGIWIVITLLSGLLGAAVYAIVRIGDKQT